MSTSQWRADTRVVLLGALAISAAYLGWHLGRGWIPYDDGALAQTAERVLQGELPHRDFDDIYTGGLAFLNAAAFRLIGTTLWSLRLVMFAVFIAWVPTVYSIAARFVRPLAAATITLLAVVWSVPNYTAAMPSWYNLFLATFGVAMLLRHLEDERTGWLVAAGVMGGLSFLVKVVGLYYVAGVLLFLVFQAHARARSAAGPQERRGDLYALFVSAALLVFVASLAALVRRQLHVPEVVQFVMPGALIAALLVRNEWTQPAGDSRGRLAGLAKLVAPFLAGVALPVVLFLVPYARSGALGAFAYGVFVLPMKRFGVASVPALSVWTMLTLVPLALLAALAGRAGPRVRRYAGAVSVIVAALLFLATGWSDPLYRSVWYSARNLLPVLVVVGVTVLWRVRAVDAEQPQLRARLMLLLSVAGLCSLVQFPYFVPNYFSYVAPLVLLTAVALCGYLQPKGALIPATVLAFYLVFAAVRTNDSTLYTMGVTYQPYLRTVPLGLGRGGVDVPVVHAEAYRKLVPMLRARAKSGYIWASPDAPEMYFLSGLKNPTRSLFDFFDDTTGRTARVLEALDKHDVTVVVLNARPTFSPAPPVDLIGELESRYPFATNIGPYQVRWKP
ncbi:MAG: ArnT family glycosyltransferase [Gemmatimonadaceae bacterium]